MRSKLSLIVAENRKTNLQQRWIQLIINYEISLKNPKQYSKIVLWKIKHEVSQNSPKTELIHTIWADARLVMHNVLGWNVGSCITTRTFCLRCTTMFKMHGWLCRSSSFTFSFLAVPRISQASSLPDTSLLTHLWIIELEFLQIRSKMLSKSEIEPNNTIISKEVQI